MQKTIFLKQLRMAILSSALACCTNGYAEIEKTNCRTGDTAPPAVSKLVPTGWSLEYFAFGTLTGQSRKDLVMSVAKQAKGAFGNAEARRLIVATKAGAGYKIIASGDHALQLGLGPAGTDPFVYTSKNQIVTQAFGGSRYKFTENYYFALTNKKWLMTRFRLNGDDTLSGSHSSNTIDVNVLTGHVDAMMSREKHKTQRVAFNEIFSLRSINGSRIPDDAPKLKIADASKKFSAEIRSAHTATEIRIEVLSSFVNADEEAKASIFVTDGSGKKIPAKHNIRSISGNKFIHTLLFNLPEGIHFSNPNGDSNRFLNWIVHIEKIDKANPNLNIKLSTASAGSRGLVHGGILTLTQNSILTLQNANTQNGSFQEAPIDTPQE